MSLLLAVANQVLHTYVTETLLCLTDNSVRYIVFHGVCTF